MGPDLYDGRNDEAATITIDSHDWRVVSTSGNVSHAKESRTFEQLKSDAITLDRILAEPEAFRNETVAVVCYWINHVEGAWLASSPDTSLDATLTLGSSTTSWFVEIDGTELMDQWDLDPTRRVVISGTLRIGDLDHGMVDLTNHPYLDVDVVFAAAKPNAEQD